MKSGNGRRHGAKAAVGRPGRGEKLDRMHSQAITQEVHGVRRTHFIRRARRETALGKGKLL